ncbi:MAG: DUF4111 domain-containing protein [Pseudomonadales bacterium]|nr:DUF4111 domain-containing protein [Pseudomonadales bacterium]
MTYLHSQNLVPETAIAQLEALTQLLQQTLHKSLLGLILHGSAASAGFEVERSDLDVLAIIDSELTHMQHQTVGEGMLWISNEPHPLEFSIIVKEDLDNWSHPCKHVFHYGEDKREAFSVGRFKPDVLADEDLAGHITMARARGIDLLGNYPPERLPFIPREDYLSAILSDIQWAQNQQEDLDYYSVANACRTMAYLDSGAILSKSEGIEWCRDNNIDTSKIVEEVTTKLRLELGL